ncbi:MAG: alanine racemase, partial [Planctomycetota bacterium]
MKPKSSVRFRFHFRRHLPSCSLPRQADVNSTAARRRRQVGLWRKGFLRINDAIGPTSRDSWRGGHLVAQVSAGALRHNIALVRQQLAPGVKLCAVVKANAYGHGLDLLLPTIAPAADYLAVAAAAEALELRWLGYKGKLLTIFTPSLCPEDEQADMLDELTLAGVTLTVVTEAEARAVDAAAARTGTCATVHVKIDTGMRRSGVELDQAQTLVQALGRLPHIRLEGLYTHF